MKKILIIGGTGTLGKTIIPMLLNHGVEQIRIMARHEHDINAINNQRDTRLLGIIGDVRDRKRVMWASEGIDTLLHFAANKTIDGVEHNPGEGILTNIIGTWNVIAACKKNFIKKAVFTSTDKAVAPYNMYGATKLVAEKMFINAMIGDHNTMFSCVRYGNVFGSQGSVVEKFSKQEVIEITDPEMTRFWFLPKDAAALVFTALYKMRGGEIYIPYMKASTMLDLALAFNKPYKITGKRRGEKKHECLLTANEASECRMSDDVRYFIKYPTHEFYPVTRVGKEIASDFAFTSDIADRYTKEELQDLLTQAGAFGWKTPNVRRWLCQLKSS